MNKIIFITISLLIFYVPSVASIEKNYGIYALYGVVNFPNSKSISSIDNPLLSKGGGFFVDFPASREIFSINALGFSIGGAQGEDLSKTHSYGDHSDLTLKRNVYGIVFYVYTLRALSVGIGYEKQNLKFRSNVAEYSIANTQPIFHLSVSTLFLSGGVGPYLALGSNLSLSTKEETAADSFYGVIGLAF